MRREKPKPYDGWALVLDGEFVGHMVYVDVHRTKRGAEIEARACRPRATVARVRIVPAPKGARRRG